MAKEFVVALSENELRKFGGNAKQCFAHHGVLCEVIFNESVKCFKKPKYRSWFLNYQVAKTPDDYRIHYTNVNLARLLQ